MFSYDASLVGRTGVGTTRSSSSSSSSWPCAVALVAPEEGLGAEAVLGAELGGTLGDFVDSGMHENWSHLARKALRPAPWSFNAACAIDTSLWKRWFARS